MRRYVLSLFFLLVAAAVHAQDLRLDYERESLLGTYRHYTQYVNGLPVLGGEVIEHVARDGTVREVHRAIATPAPKRALIPKSKAIASASPGAVEDAQLVALNLGGEARRVWRVVVEEKPHEPVARYIDAVTGTLLVSQPLFAQITAKGRVFDTNPVAEKGASTMALCADYPEVYAVIGAPIEQSLSPAIHNAWIAAGSVISTISRSAAASFPRTSAARFTAQSPPKVAAA